MEKSEQLSSEERLQLLIDFLSKQRPVLGYLLNKTVPEELEIEELEHFSKQKFEWDTYKRKIFIICNVPNDNMNHAPFTFNILTSLTPQEMEYYDHQTYDFKGDIGKVFLITYF